MKATFHLSLDILILIILSYLVTIVTSFLSNNNNNNNCALKRFLSSLVGKVKNNGRTFNKHQISFARLGVGVCWQSVPKIQLIAFNFCSRLCSGDSFSRIQRRAPVTARTRRSVVFLAYLDSQFSIAVCLQLLELILESALALSVRFSLVFGLVVSA